jgi:two-component system sensor histidine kinase KdpD
VTAGLARRLALLIAVAVPSLAVATLGVGLLQDRLGVPNPSAVYLVAVVAIALVAGTPGAIAASVASFLLYNFLFTEPRGSFSITDPGVWLSVVLLLFVGIVVGQLVALERSRTAVAQAREREARALFQLSRGLATRADTAVVLPEIARILGMEARMRRVWVALGGDDASERVVADTGDGPRLAQGGLVRVLRRMPGDMPATWVRVHQALRPGAADRGEGRGPGEDDLYRVRIEASAASLGSIWAIRDRGLGIPDRTATRLLAAAADQIGQAFAQDQLAGASRAAEVARQSDALKSALLQSVSHDLRTPLAAIRMAAGTLRVDSGVAPDERRQSVDAIEREVEHLNRLVTNLLDLSRIEAGGLRVERDAVELDDVLGRAVERLRPRLDGRKLEVHLETPPVEADPILLEAAFTNVAENAVSHTPTGTTIRIAAHAIEGGFIRLTIEDDGPGVPDEALPRLCERFYRVPGPRGASRPGTGIGLAVVRGLVGAMRGRVVARRSEMGGLAIDIDLPIAAVPAELTDVPAGSSTGSAE